MQYVNMCVIKYKCIIKKISNSTQLAEQFLNLIFNFFLFFVISPWGRTAQYKKHVKRGKNRFLELSRNQERNLYQIFTRAHTVN